MLLDVVGEMLEEDKKIEIMWHGKKNAIQRRERQRPSEIEERRGKLIMAFKIRNFCCSDKNWGGRIGGWQGWNNA